MNKRKIPNRLGFIITIIAIIILGFLALSIFATTTETTGQLNIKIENQESYISKNLISFLQKDIITEPQRYKDSPILGNPDAPISIFEFNSFGCEFGSKIQPILKQIIEKYPNQVKLIWKDLPLISIYPGADLVHQATRCAQNQGKFWEYHDQAWLISDDINSESLTAIAEKINLDISLFESCIQKKATNDKVNRDVLEADQLLIPGTPHFYIGTQEIMGTAELEDFERLIKVELNRKVIN